MRKIYTIKYVSTSGNVLVLTKNNHVLFSKPEAIELAKQTLHTHKAWVEHAHTSKIIWEPLK